MIYSMQIHWLHCNFICDVCKIAMQNNWHLVKPYCEEYNLFNANSLASNTWKTRFTEICSNHKLNISAIRFLSALIFVYYQKNPNNSLATEKPDSFHSYGHHTNDWYLSCISYNDCTNYVTVNFGLDIWLDKIVHYITFWWMDEKDL